MKVLALLLAAGQSRRFGEQDKRSVRMPDGGLLVNAMLRRLKKAGVEARVGIRRHDNIAPLLVGETIVCPRGQEGMGGTIADMLNDVMTDSALDAVMLMPADLPLIRVSTLAALAASASPERIVLPQCDGRQGHPVVFGRRFFPALSQLCGDRGGKAIITDHPECCDVIVVSDPGIYLDGDTPAAMAALLVQLSPKNR
ncbi:putative MobA-like protein [Spongiibacter sp. IMCC21906]|uniref:nucleotidyltransferase family protein n=1 Tax=Spongiibacter sp. IMCC21906 TaxID=1620392 RepID=UPI00062DDD79|nr:nucleotidyltransferase family protein [Spongiibacter sp. IMCC21906]AKH69970.1 putative MobA-like protein [Spongiibacter sp. IMCC21906]